MKEKKANAVIMDERDNVGTAIIDINQGEMVKIKLEQGWLKLEAVNSIAYGHKIAIVPIKESETIIKYGEIIGTALGAIQTGEHVHIHNVDSLRGKGR